MTTLLHAACADVREASSYAKEPMPMKQGQAAAVITDFAESERDELSELQNAAFALAIAALRADDLEESGSVNYWRNRANSFQGELKELAVRLDVLDDEKCEYVNLYRDAEQRAETLERALRLALDALDDKEAGS